MENGMERKIYLIFSDSVDTVCEIKGYIRGTMEDAQTYCEDLNRANGEQEKEFVFMELTQLVANQRWKTAMPSGFTTVTKTAERWGVSEARVYQLCKDGRIPGVVFDKDHWCVPVDAEKPSVRKAKAAAAVRVEGYLSVDEIAEKWGLHRETVLKLCIGGRISGTKRVGKSWYIPADAQKPANKSLEREPGFVSASEMAKRWGVSRNFVCKASSAGRIPGAKQIGKYWHIPEDAVNPAKR